MIKSRSNYFAVFHIQNYLSSIIRNFNYILKIIYYKNFKYTYIYISEFLSERFKSLVYLKCKQDKRTKERRKTKTKLFQHFIYLFRNLFVRDANSTILFYSQARRFIKTQAL